MTHFKLQKTKASLVMKTIYTASYEKEWTIYSIGTSTRWMV